LVAAASAAWKLGIVERPEGFDVTTQKQLKLRIRARMAMTGERYAAARAQIVKSDGDVTTPRLTVDQGWTLRGGCDPDAAALANVLANRGVTGPDGALAEDLLFVVAGGLGAGYILWEFAHDDSRVVTLGFTNSWNYQDRRLTAACERLGLRTEWFRTAGAAKAATDLRRQLSAGQPVVVWPDWYGVGYWHLPESLHGHGGHPVIAYAEEDGRIHVDDRNLAPLTVAGDDLDQARARIGSYRNAMLAVRSSGEVISDDRLRTAVLRGLHDHVDHLGKASDSFALPAWRKWSRLLVATKPAKAWPRVFADGVGLFGALLSVWEGIEPAGMWGGHLRGLFADGLKAAAAILDESRLAAEASGWEEIAGLWHEAADAAVPLDVPECARARELTAAVTGAVTEGDTSKADREAAATKLWDLRAAYATSPPLDADQVAHILEQLSGLLQQIFDAETAALQRLRRVVEG
jgi:hypothetical protein